MRPASLFFSTFGLIATACFLLVGSGQKRNDEEDLRQLRAATIARGIAFAASAELAEIKAFEESPPPPEGQPAPEPPVPGAKTQKLIDGLVKELRLRRTFVLQGTQFWAHSDPDRAKKRLDRESVEDKELYDRASKLKAAVAKNAEERERNPKMERDAYLEVIFSHLPGGMLDRVTVPVKSRADLLAIVELELAPPPPLEAGLPLGALWTGLGAIVLFVALLELVVKDKLAARASAVLVGAALLAVVGLEARALVAWHGGVREITAEAQAKLFGAMGRAGLFAEGRAKLDVPPEVVRDLRGQSTALVAVLPATRSATTSPALSIPTQALTEDGVTSYFSKAGATAEESRDAWHLLLWSVGIGALALLGFALGMIGKLARARMALSEHSSAYLYMLPAGMGLLILVFIPVAVGLTLGFQAKNYGVWEFAGLANYIGILGDGDLANPQNFYFKLGVTVLWTVVNVAFHVGIGLFLALLLNDMMLRARGIYRVILIVPWAIPNYITALIWKGMFHKQFGAVNFFLEAVGLPSIAWFQSFWPAFTTNVSTNIWLGFPFMMVISLGALQSISADLYEAARVDGASRWQRFRNITLPLLMPALVPSVIVGTVWTFNMFNIIYLVSGGAPDGKTDILITEAYRWAFERSREGYAAAYSTLIFIILLCFSLATNRITGATKGVFE